MPPGPKASSRSKQQQTENVAGAYLALLADRGVDYLFGNAGTDFAPLIEAYAQAAQTGVAVPRPILATHENLAVTMAHGYGMVSRRIPAVMVHVSVGTANMICAAMNAARENVAILLTAGRSPLTETGLPGSRDGYIHWAQEMYDQAGMIREIVKWDYELRNAEQLTTVVDRALAIAATEPRGPVYLSLPREVIAAPASQPEQRSPPSRLTRGGPRGAGRQCDCRSRAHPCASEAAADRDGECRTGCRDIRSAGAVHRAFCDPGGPASAALSLAAVLASDESRISSGAAGAGGRRDPGDRKRRALAPQPGRARQRLQDRPLRARPVVHALPDPRLPVRRRDHRQHPCDTVRADHGARRRARCASARAAPALDQGRARGADRDLEERARCRGGQEPARSCLGEPLHRSRQGCALHCPQRVHAVPRALHLRVAGPLFRIELRVRARLGAGRRAWGEAGAARTARSWPSSATAPTCSAILRRCTMLRPCTSCPCSLSS